MRNFNKMLAAGAALISTQAADVRADLPSRNDERLKIEEVVPTPQVTEKVQRVYAGPLFKIDSYTAASEGTESQRKALLDDLIGELTVPENIKKDTDSQGVEYDFLEKSYPLIVEGRKLEIKISIYPDSNEIWFRVIDPLSDATLVGLIDSGMTGAPSAHQLPVTNGDKVRPQDFAVFSEDTLATKLYFGILQHLLSRQ